MGLKERRELFTELQSLRNSKVISMWHSDRLTDAPIPAMTTHLASDQQAIIYQHLKSIGHTERLDLILYTRGGDTTMPWPLVNMIRTYCNHFTVLVPFRAHSAGTMICLGADEVVMSSIGELSPIDPTTANAFNPRDKANPQNVLGISVEDVTAFIELANKRVGLKNRKDKGLVLEALTKEISPVALGNVNRVLSYIRMVGRKLLELSAPQIRGGANIDEMLNKLTIELHSHAHLINRKEARESIGLNVEDAKPKEEELLWSLYLDYADEMQLNDQFKIRGFLGNSPQQNLEVKGAFIESVNLAHLYRGRYLLQQRTDISKLHPQLAGQIITQQAGVPPLIPGMPVGIEIIPIEEGWIEQK